MGKLQKAALMFSGRMGILMILVAELDIPKTHIFVIPDISGSMG